MFSRRLASTSGAFFLRSLQGSSYQGRLPRFEHALWHVILVYIFRYFLRPSFSSSTQINTVYSLIQYFKFQHIAQWMNKVSAHNIHPSTTPYLRPSSTSLSKPEFWQGKEPCNIFITTLYTMRYNSWITHIPLNAIIFDNLHIYKPTQQGGTECHPARQLVFCSQVRDSGDRANDVAVWIEDPEGYARLVLLPRPLVGLELVEYGC